MQKEVLKEPTYVEELLTLFRSNLGKEELLEKISDYHESDIADAMEQMTPEERKKLYPLLGEEYIAEILSYTEDAAEYLQEINLENAARVISEMDSDDAVDVLENLDADTKTRIVDLLDDLISHQNRLVENLGALDDPVAYGGDLVHALDDGSVSLGQDIYQLHEGFCMGGEITVLI